jgi:hypothetical protein
MQDDGVKARLHALYASVDFERLRHAIRKDIARKRLQLREDADRDLLADLSLREAFVELLLSYQLPWLQLGLEVVLGVEVHKTRIATGRDGQLLRLSTLGALKALIAQRVLSDPGVCQRYGGSSARVVHGRAREAMQLELRALLIERFLCLVALLDEAKRMEVLPRRRPLFKSSAAVKSSAEVGVRACVRACVCNCVFTPYHRWRGYHCFAGDWVTHSTHGKRRTHTHTHTRKQTNRSCSSSPRPT